MAIELHHLNTHGLFRDATKMIDGVAKLKERIAELEKENAELKEQYRDMDVTHTVHIAKMNALIEELEESQRWRKCSEELPEDGADVLATDGEGIWLCYKTTTPDGLPWFQPDGQPHIEGVSHWMPLPKSANGGKMTHADFAKRVINEWGVDPRQIHQSCFEAWYHYTTEVEGKKNIIGEYTLRNLKPAFVLTKKDGTEKVWEA